mmetsp:Transcript_2851/g.5392  ORF Transcript_2851/g.5392 Transcript_2851/m.5392 type:complete len:80 (-) Transcript_2851:185-424(-)
MNPPKRIAPKPMMLTAGFITAGSLVAENIDSMAGGTAISAASSCCAATAGNLGLEMATLGATVVVARDEVSGTAAVQAD